MLEVTPWLDEPDEQRSLGVYNAVWPHDTFAMADVRSFKESVRDHVDLLARVGGAAVGSGVGAIFPQRADRVYTIVTVLAEHRRSGVGSALYKAISAWAGERGLSELEVAVLDNDRESLAFAHRRGFVEERRELGLVLDLAEVTAPQVELPDGVEILSWAERPELAYGLYEVALEALPDIPGLEADDIEPFDGWLAHAMQGSGDRPEATLVALAGEQVVGYAKFALREGQPTIAYHDLSAVRRAWRGRGIARALKAAQINWALANGYTELRTSNEQRNAPIRHLNAAFGYRPGIGRIYLAGPLAVS